MAVAVTHAFVSPVADQGNPDEVGPNEWNAEHTISGLGTAAEADASDFATVATYDPQAIGGDAFARANHTGTQSIATVSGLQSALDAKADEAGLGTAAQEDVEAFASAAQGALADTAVQPADLATVATSGDYDDLTDKPTLGTAASQDSTAFATAAQGATADAAAPQATTYTKDEVDTAVAGATPGDDSITNAKLANMAASTFKGRVTGSTGDPEDLSATQARAILDNGVMSGFRDRLINGNGTVNQRGATSQADDTYAWDRHYVLTQTAAIGISTVSDVADGLPSMMRLTQSQATAQRMGVAQIIEAANCKDLRGETVTLLGKLRCSSAQAIRYAILEWTGTADTVTSDVVADWANASFTAGQFFNSTTLTVRQVGTITPGAAAVTDFLLTATLGSTFNNLIVVMWTEGTAAQNVTLDVAWEFVKDDVTGQAYPLEVRARGIEEVLCYRYYVRVGSEPGTTAPIGNAWSFSTTSVRTYMALPTRLRADPSVVLSGVVSYAYATGTSKAIDSVAGGNRSFAGVIAILNVTSGPGQHTAGVLYAAGANAYLAFDCEL